MGSTLASIDATLKEVYQGSVRRQLFDETVLLKRVQRSNSGISTETNGKYVTFPVHVGRNGGLGSRNEGEVLPTAGSQQYAAARLALKSGFLGIELTGNAIDMSDKDPKAFAKSLDEEMERGRVDFQKDLNRQLYGDGTGAITTVKSVVTSTTIPVNDAKLFWPNAHVIDIVTAPSTVVASQRLVTAVDTTPGANTITISGANVTTVVGQLIVVTGSVNRELTGIGAIIANTGILYNINPSTTPEWKSEVNSNAGTPRALSENLMIQLVDRVRRRGGKTTVIVTDDGSYRSYWNLLAQLRGFVNTQDFTGGFKGLAFAAGNQEIPIVSDYDAPAGKMNFLNEDDLTYYRDEDIHWLDRDGSILKQKIDQATAGRIDAWQAHMLERHELGIGRRNTHALLSDLITS
jgi:hypothetical protein